MWRKSVKLVVFVSLVATSLLCGEARAATAVEPEGYGRFHWGMREDQVKDSFPSVAFVDPGDPGTPAPPFTMHRYELQGEKVGAFKNCTVHLLFFNKIFYRYEVNCPAEKAAIEKYLSDSFGPPTVVRDPVREWTKPKTHVSYTAASGIFLVEETATTQQVNMALLSYLLRSGQAPPAVSGAVVPGGNDSSKP